MSSAARDKRLPPSNLTEAYYLPATVITINIKHPPIQLENNLKGLTPCPSRFQRGDPALTPPPAILDHLLSLPRPQVPLNFPVTYSLQELPFSTPSPTLPSSLPDHQPFLSLADPLFQLYFWGFLCTVCYPLVCTPPCNLGGKTEVGRSLLPRL